MAKSIMIQGTTSNAGKSLITAGLCRIFHQDGYRVAPFKSQNMALNSFITKEGLEMGRAQVMQAECAKKEPDVRMNPILLKPNSDMGSQVIVNGEVVKNMPAREYFAYKKQLIPQIMESYNSLAEENDIIVLEGAGSPAEINLKQEDIVNMGLAQMTKSPVLITGDIDRGGVFAALYGTVMLLTEEERSLVKGVIINKFRGDVSILKPGLTMLEDLIHLPVTGVVPYLKIDVDDEDSLSQRFQSSGKPGLIDIAVIRLPRISNFTDFNIFESMDGVRLRYVGSAGEFGEPDLVILPGTKNTMEDLRWLRSGGLEGQILKHAEKGKPIIGICGGFQMLGMTLKDPTGVEHGGEMSGLGLMEHETVFLPEKTRTRVTGHFQPIEGIFAGLAGLEFEGYEIHMGRTTALSAGSKSFSILDSYSAGGERVKTDGLCVDNIYGTYVHGIFDAGDIAAEVVKALCLAKGIDFDRIKTIDSKSYKEMQYDLLADGLRRSLDMEQIYKILEAGV